MKERLEILKALGDKGEKRPINSNNEQSGACRHTPKFHRYTNTTNSSADEGSSPEICDVTTDKYTSSIKSTSSINNCYTYVNTNIIEEFPTEGKPPHLRFLLQLIFRIW